MIRVAECSKRRTKRAYFGWRSDSYTYLAPGLHRRGLLCSSTQRENAAGHQHSHRYGYSRDQSVIMPSDDNLSLGGAAAACARHDVGNQECKVTAHCRSLPTDEGLAVTSRSPVPRTQSSSVLDRHGAAMAARNRLDERLRAASLVNRRSSNSFQGHELPATSVLFDEDESSIRKDNLFVDSCMIGGLARRVRSFEVSHSGYDSRSLKSNETIRQVTIRGSEKEPSMRGRKRARKESRKSKTRDCPEQEDCPVCLEQFSLDEAVIRLACNHRFHRDCLTPWLESHGHCPCCRAKVSDKAALKSSPMPGSVNQNVIQPRNGSMRCITTIKALLRKLGL